MSHIHTGPGQHDLTASAFIVRLDTPKPTLMLHVHKKLGKYLQFGGHVELHETPWQAIAHELIEESGYDMGQLQVLQPKHRLQHLTGVDLQPYPVYLQTHRFPGIDHYHTDIAFAFITREEPRHPVSGDESREIKLFTLEELQSLSNNMVVENVRETAIFVLTECLRRWEPLSTLHSGRQ